MGIKKQFSNIEDAKKLGRLLRVVDSVLLESLIISANSLGKTDKLTKRIQNIFDKISKLRSDIDDDLIRILPIELYRGTENKELNEITYSGINEKTITEFLDTLKEE